MTTTLVIDNSSPQAKQFVKFARTQPFRRKAKPQNEWDKAIAEGAVTVDEFIDELKHQLREHYANA